MDAELTALAAAGATALVQQMVTDGWGNVRDRAAAILSRGREGETAPGGPDEAAESAELETSRAELVAAQDAGDADAAADVQASWRARLRRALRDDPAAAAELRSLLAELGPGPAAGTAAVRNSVHGSVHGVVVQGHTFGGRMTVGGPGAARNTSRRDSGSPESGSPESGPDDDAVVE